MNPIKRWFVERWLKGRGWKMARSPYRDCMVYWHPGIPRSTGDLEYAVGLEKKRAIERQR